MIEAIFVLQFFVIPFKNDPDYYYSDSFFFDGRIQCPAGECCASPASVVWAFVTQFCLLSSELWFAAICRDLQLAYTNPFSSYQENKRYFAAVITVVALCSSFALVYLVRPDRIGVSAQGFMWVQSSFRNFYDPVATEVYFVWFYLALSYSVYTIYRYGGGEDMNLAGTVSTRLPIMKKGRRFVLGYCSYWGLVALAEMTYLFATDAVGTSKAQNYSVIGYCLAYRGPYALAIIFFSNYESMAWEKAFPFWYASVAVAEAESLSGVAEKLAMAPHLNKALRAEILFFTSEGIRVSALENLARKRLAKKQRRAEGVRGATNSDLLDHMTISADTYQFSHGKLGNLQPKAMSPRLLEMQQPVLIGIGVPSETDDDDGVSDSGEEVGMLAEELEFLENLAQEELEPEPEPELAAARHPSVDSMQTTARKESRDRLRASYTRESYSYSIFDAAARREDKDFKPAWSSMEEGRGSSREGVRLSAAPHAADCYGRRQSSGHAGGRSSASDSEYNRGSASLRASLDEGQLSRLSLLEEQQDQALDEMVGSYLQDHLPGAQDKDLRSSISSVRSSFGLRGASSKAGNNPLAMETLSEETREKDSMSESFSSDSRDSTRDIEMNARQPSKESLSETDLSWRDSGATAAAHHDAASRGSRDPRDASAVPAPERGAELSAARMVLPQTLNGTEWKVRRTSGAGLPQGLNAGSAGASASGSGTPSSSGGREAGEARGGNRALSVLRHGAELAKTQLLLLFQQSLYEFEFIDYCPRLFSLVRQLCGISEIEYAAAFESVTGEDFSEGRSGSFTFFSKSGEFFVKAQTLEEISSLREMLPAYVRYLSKHRSSLLIKFLGAHRIKMYGKELYFIIMCNVFPKDVVIHERWDLKGSWVQRHGNAGVFVTGRGEVMKKESPLYFDNDIHHGIELHPAAATSIFHQLKEDAHFLAAQGLMDYSLLVGVVKARMEVLDNVVPADYSKELLRNLTRDNPFLLDSSGGLRPICVEGASTYYVGMIDLLQRWNLKKKVEYYLKTLVLGRDKEGISAIDPAKYCQRFINRVTKKLFVGIHDEKAPSRMAGSPSGVASVSSLATSGLHAASYEEAGAGRMRGREFDSLSVQSEEAEHMSPLHGGESGAGGSRPKTNMYPASNRKQSMSNSQHESASSAVRIGSVDISSSKNRRSVSVRVSKAQSSSGIGSSSSSTASLPVSIGAESARAQGSYASSASSSPSAQASPSGSSGFSRMQESVLVDSAATCISEDSDATAHEQL